MPHQINQRTQQLQRVLYSRRITRQHRQKLHSREALNRHILQRHPKTSMNLRCSRMRMMMYIWEMRLMKMIIIISILSIKQQKGQHNASTGDA